MSNDPTEEKILVGRSSIKQYATLLYDYYWKFCDQERFYEFGLQGLSTACDLDAQLLASGTTSLYFAYDDFIFMIAHAVASDNVANEMTDSALANYFRFSQRNIYARNGFMLYFRLLDHLSFHLNELSQGKLVSEKPREVDFAKLCKTSNEQDGISPLILKGVKFVKEHAYEGFSQDLQKWLEKQRNADIHRFSLGIDHIAYPVSRANADVRPDERSGLLFIHGNSQGNNLNYYGGPDVKFEDLGAILIQMGRNAKRILKGLAQIGCIAHASHDEIIKRAFPKEWIHNEGSEVSS